MDIETDTGKNADTVADTVADEDYDTVKASDRPRHMQVCELSPRTYTPTTHPMCTPDIFHNHISTKMGGACTCLSIVLGVYALSSTFAIFT